MRIFSMFDGVGGFPYGLNNADCNYFKTIYSNQFEPSRKSQDAYEISLYNFPHIKHINKDICLVSDKKLIEMRNNKIDMIVGGFPCQDYSVARTKKGALGIEGKKGVLFWQIIRATNIINPKYLILENVDRLLKSPANQRGRDFAIILSSFNNLGYSVEWRILNAADYGFPQKRKRIFLFIYRNDTNFYLKNKLNQDYIFKTGLFARQFPIENSINKNRIISNTLSKDIINISENFSSNFFNTGIMKNGKYLTIDTISIKEKGKVLGDILLKEKAPEKYFLSDEKLEKFKYLRGSKKIERISKNGHKYIYAEGAMSAYDSLSNPARTILTSEGGISRSTHIIKIDNRYRLLTPIECERLQGFPDNWTQYKHIGLKNKIEVSDRIRIFCMGNALVTGLVERIGIELKKIDLDI